MACGLQSARSVPGCISAQTDKNQFGRRGGEVATAVHIVDVGVGGIDGQGVAGYQADQRSQDPVPACLTGDLFGTCEHGSDPSMDHVRRVSVCVATVCHPGIRRASTALLPSTEALPTANQSIPAEPGSVRPRPWSDRHHDASRRLRCGQRRSSACCTRCDDAGWPGSPRPCPRPCPRP